MIFAEKGKSRRQWYKIRADAARQVLLCAIYGPLVDQEEFRARTLDEIEGEAAALRSPDVALMVAGDLNLHLKAAGARSQ